MHSFGTSGMGEESKNGKSEKLTGWDKGNLKGKTKLRTQAKQKKEFMRCFLSADGRVQPFRKAGLHHE